MSIIQRQPPRKAKIGPRSCARCVRWFGPSYALLNETAYCVTKKHNTAAADTCNRFEARAEKFGGTGEHCSNTAESGAPVRTCPKCGRVGRFAVVSICGRRVCDRCAAGRFQVRDVEAGIVGATPGFVDIQAEPGGGSVRTKQAGRRKNAQR